MRIAIVGTPDYPRLHDVASYVMTLPADSIVYGRGDIYGGDRTALEAAKQRCLPTMELTPNWGIYGDNAESINDRLLVEQVDCVIAFWDSREPRVGRIIQRCRQAEKHLIIQFADGGMVELHKPSEVG